MDSQRQTTTGKQWETQQRQRTGRGAHIKQAEQRKRKGEGGGEKAHGTQPWQAEEQKRKAEQATKQNHPAARQLKRDSKGKEQTHSWGKGERGDWEGGKGGKSERKERDGKRREGVSQALRTAPMDPPGEEEGAPSYTRVSKVTPEKGGRGKGTRPAPDVESITSPCGYSKELCP